MNNAIPPLTSMPAPSSPVTDLAVPSGARGGARPGGEFAATTPQPAAPQAPLRPNPSFRIDGALGLVVIEFHDDSGKVKSTIPTARQLDAYRLSSAHGPPAAKTAAGHAATPAGTTEQVATAGTVARPAAATGAAGKSAADASTAVPERSVPADQSPSESHPFPAG